MSTGDVMVFANGTSTLPWASTKAPAGFAVHTVTLGMGAGDALEVVTVTVDSGVGVSQGALTAIHKERLGSRIVPVAVVAVSGGRAWIFGPAREGGVAGPFADEQASRMLDVALAEPSGLQARQRLAALLEHATGGGDADHLPGVANSGLFATNELRSGVRARADWSTAVENARGLLGKRRTDLVTALGFTASDAAANAYLLSEGAAPRAVAVLLDEGEHFDAQSAKYQVSPVAYGIHVAQANGVPWVLLLRGSQVRLYPARPEVGVGRKGLAETFFELDLALVTDDTAGYLSLVFTAAALAEGGTTGEILQSSAQYAVGLGERLRDRVYGEIIPDLALEVAMQLQDGGLELDRAGLAHAYEVTLRIFFRLLFQAYAEDRKLLPYGENAAYTRNALKTLATDLIDADDESFDANVSSHWRDLTQVWEAIDRGNRNWSIPAYNGGLFSSDSELHPENASIDSIAIPDSVMGPVIRSLMVDTDEDGTRGLVDFRTLGVREFGTIYEGLLESNLSVTDIALTLDENDAWVPAGKRDTVWAEAGSVYFHNSSGQRKATGSYFTPTFVVEHLLERALDPALDAHLARVAALLEEGDQAGAAERFFDFRIADLAMGSAHFLTAAIDHCEQRMAAFLADHSVPGVAKELDALEAAAKDAAGPDAPDPERSSLLRRQIARRCIYGLDINPIAVELARVGIWIHTFVRGLPMSGLDHNLVCRNSLTGIGTVEEAIEVLSPGHKGTVSMFEDSIRTALEKSRNALGRVARLPELNREETKEVARAVIKARAEAEHASLLFDAAVLMRTGNGSLVNAAEPNAIIRLAGSQRARAALSPLAPAHLPALFPEVFLRTKGGFDVIVGNPPWDELHVNADKFWTRYFPGHMALSDAKKAAARKKYEKLRPDLAQLLSDEVAETKYVGAAIKAACAATDLYHAFLWRFNALSHSATWFGVVLPRGATVGASMGNWRREALAVGAFREVFHCVNRGGWLFADADGRLQIILLTFERGASGDAVETLGTATSRATFQRLRASSPLNLSVAQLERISPNCAIPALPRPDLANAFMTMREAPSISDRGTAGGTTIGFDGIARVVREAKHVPEGAAGALGVIQGRHIRHWQRPDPGEWIAGLSAQLEARPGIVFRKLARSDDSRTFICTLAAAGTFVKETGYWLELDSDDEREMCFTAGVLSSRVFDWYTRCLVDRHILPSLSGSFPLPIWNPKRESHLEIARMTASHFSAIGVVGGTKDSIAMTPESEAKLDGLVARSFGLSAEQLHGILETFHPTWDHHAHAIVAEAALKRASNG